MWELSKEGYFDDIPEKERWRKEYHFGERIVMATMIYMNAGAHDANVRGDNEARPALEDVRKAAGKLQDALVSLKERNPHSYSHFQEWYETQAGIPPQFDEDPADRVEAVLQALEEMLDRIEPLPKHRPKSERDHTLIRILAEAHLAAKGTPPGKSEDGPFVKLVHRSIGLVDPERRGLPTGKTIARVIDRWLANTGQD